MVNNQQYQYQPVLQTGQFISCRWCDENNYVYQQLAEYIDYKFKQYSRLLVIRLDLGFVDGTTCQWSAEDARANFQKFLNNRRMLALFKNEVGFAWVLECGPEKGFHYHLIFLFNGALSQQDQSIGHAIGQYWKNKINNGSGNYYCSNDNKVMFKEQGLLGIGMIHRSDEQARANLLSNVSYLAKDDELLQGMLPESSKRFRTFGKGEIPKNLQNKK